MTVALLLLGVLNVLGFSEAQDLVNIEVFYESLCPDSGAFFEDQLVKANDQLGDYLNVQLVPYGNAQTYGGPDAYTFTCQHGSDECYGNMVQTCFTNLVNKTDENIKFINCAFRVHVQKKTIEKCITDKLVSRMVTKCVESPLGKNLEYEMGKRTDALNPTHSFIPWITVNGRGSNEINNKANQNLIGLICDELGNQKPDVCNKQKKNSYRYNYL